MLLQVVTCLKKTKEEKNVSSCINFLLINLLVTNMRYQTPKCNTGCNQIRNVHNSCLLWPRSWKPHSKLSRFTCTHFFELSDKDISLKAFKIHKCRRKCGYLQYLHEHFTVNLEKVKYMFKHERFFWQKVKLRTIQ